MSRSPIFRPLSALGRSPPIRFRSEAVRIWCGLGPLASVLRRASSVLFGLLSYCSRSLPFLLLYSARFFSLVMLRRARTSSYHRHALVVVYKDPLVAPWEATVLRPLVSRRVLFLPSCTCIDVYLSPAFSYVGSPELDVVFACHAPAGTLPSRPPPLTSRGVVTLGRKTVYGTGAFVPHSTLHPPLPSSVLRRSFRPARDASDPPTPAHASGGFLCSCRSPRALSRSRVHTPLLCVRLYAGSL